MIKLPWGQKVKQVNQPEKTNIDAALNGNFINLDKQEQYQRWPDRRPTHDALLMCNALKQGKLDAYLGPISELPKKKIIKKFLGIICSKSNNLPFLNDDEMPSIIIENISFDPIQNVQGRMMTKITLLLIIERESKKLGIWNQLQQIWTQKYILETKTYVQILEAIVKQCENSDQKDKALSISNSIKLIKEANVQYTIDW
jgi:hypothetical protein